MNLQFTPGWPARCEFEFILQVLVACLLKLFDVFLRKKQTPRSETGRRALGLGIARAIGLRPWLWPCPFPLPVPLALPFSLGLATLPCPEGVNFFIVPDCMSYLQSEFRSP